MDSIRTRYTSAQNTTMHIAPLKLLHTNKEPFMQPP